MKLSQLMIPPGVEDDPEAFEMLRAWAAKGDIYVTLETGLDGGCEIFGRLLADLVEHGTKLYAASGEGSEKDCRKEILDAFLRRTGEDRFTGGEIFRAH